MNSEMLAHPATERSIKSLSEWGCRILPTDDGLLACGDTGKGRLITPEKIVEIIRQELSELP